MMSNSVRKREISRISKVNFAKLGVRTLLFLTGTVLYILSRLDDTLIFAPEHGSFPVFFAVVWAVYAFEMLWRSFPVGFESMGCMKQFGKNYRPVEGAALPDTKPRTRTAFRVAAAWLGFNALFAAAYYLRWIDSGILILLSMAYCICDVVCVLFFCPFQTVFMKNRCCVVCHMYNWGFIMICTPFFLLPGVFTRSLLFMSIAFFLRWEVARHRHPEWFYEQTNASLRCANCTEKLCAHKKALRRLWIRQWEQFSAMEGRIPDAIRGLEEKIPETIKGLEEKIPETIKGLEEKIPETIKGLEERIPETIKEWEGKLPEQLEELLDSKKKKHRPS